MKLQFGFSRTLRGSFLGLLATGALLSIPALAQDKFESHLASEIHTINQMEIKMGELARDKGTTQDVRSYAAQIIRDHSEADTQLMKIASDLHLKVANPVATNEAERRNGEDTKLLMRKLNQSSGRNFDQAFLKGMQSGHQQVISILKTAEGDLHNDEFKAFLSRKLIPSLHHHYQIAMNLESKPVA